MALEDNNPHWNNLEEEGQVNELLTRSNDKPVLIFKHSTRCGISKSVRDKFMGNWNYSEDGPELWYLDLLQFRPVSNHIASTYNVKHESPQAILLHGGKAVWSASHYKITVDALNGALQEIAAA